MAHAELSLLEQLSVNSCPYHDPLTHLDWSQLSCDDFWLPQSAMSLQGVADYEKLPDLTKKRLSHYEFIGFIQAGLWLESIFIERLGKNLRKTQALAEHAYYLHEIREEAGHSLMFLHLMEKSGLRLPDTWRQRPRFADFLGRHAPLNTTLFWLAVVVGEEVPDKLNRHVRVHADATRLSGKCVPCISSTKHVTWRMRAARWTLAYGLQARCKKNCLRRLFVYCLNNLCARFTCRVLKFMNSPGSRQARTGSRWRPPIRPDVNLSRNASTPLCTY